MPVEEIKTNAFAALAAKGYTVSRSAECVINVSVGGTECGRAVMFFDLEAHQHYLDVFNAHGRTSEARSGPIQHGPVPPGAPRPKMPPGGLPVEP